MEEISNLPIGIKIKITKLHEDDGHWGSGGIVGEIFESISISELGSTYFKRESDGEEYCFYRRTEYELLTD